MEISGLYIVWLIILLISIVLGVHICVRRIRMTRAFFEKYTDRVDRVEHALQLSSSVVQALIEGESKLLSTESPPRYQGESLRVYNEALASWAKLFALRNRLRQRLTVSEKLIDRWNNTFFHVPFVGDKPRDQAMDELTEGTIVLDAEDLPPSLKSRLRHHLGNAELKLEDLALLLESESVQAASYYNRFLDAIESGNKRRKELSDRIYGVNGVDTEFKKLVEAGLDHPTYKAHHDRVIEKLDNLVDQICIDPLADRASVDDDIDRAIARAERAFGQTLQCMSDWQSLQEREKSLREKVRAATVKPFLSRLPEVKSSKSGLRFDEKDCRLNDLLAQSVPLLSTLSESLESRRYRKFSQTYRAFLEILEESERIYARVLADREFIEESMEKINQSSLDADLIADSSIRKLICRHYRQQRFSAGRKEVEKLEQAHSKRLAARESVARLVSPLKSFCQILETNRQAISIEVELEFEQLARQSEELRLAAQKGDSEWDALTSRSASLEEQLAGGSESLLSRAMQQVEQYSRAMKNIHQLERRWRFISENLACGWGQNADGKAWRELEAEILSVLADSEKNGQDWFALDLRAVERFVSAEAVEKAIEDELALDADYKEQLSQLTKQLERHVSGEAYSIRLCEMDFGRGVYIVEGDMQEKLKELAAHIEKRNYQAFIKHRQELLAELESDNLEAWWLVLQEMTFSVSPCARALAHTLGYVHGRYSNWSQELALGEPIGDGLSLWSPSWTGRCSCRRKFAPVSNLRRKEIPLLSDYQREASKENAA